MCIRDRATTDAGQGNLVSAADIFLRVLEERIGSYAVLYRSEVLQ